MTAEVTPKKVRARKGQPVQQVEQAQPVESTPPAPAAPAKQPKPKATKPPVEPKPRTPIDDLFAATREECQARHCPWASKNTLLAMVTVLAKQPKLFDGLRDVVKAEAKGGASAWLPPVEPAKAKAAEVG